MISGTICSVGNEQKRAPSLTEEMKQECRISKQLSQQHCKYKLAGLTAHLSSVLTEPRLSAALTDGCKNDGERNYTTPSWPAATSKAK